jgi:hypothetical protein
MPEKKSKDASGVAGSDIVCPVTLRVVGLKGTGDGAQRESIDARLNPVNRRILISRGQQWHPRSPRKKHDIDLGLFEYHTASSATNFTSRAPFSSLDFQLGAIAEMEQITIAPVFVYGKYHIVIDLRGKRPGLFRRMRRLIGQATKPCHSLEVMLLYGLVMVYD